MLTVLSAAGGGVADVSGKVVGWYAVASGASGVAQAAKLASGQDGLANWLQLLVQTGSFGLLAALGLWLYPKIRREMTKERADERRDSAKQLADAIDKFTASLDGINEDRKSERKDFQQEQRETRAFYAKENADLRKMMMELSSQFRTAIHDARDLANNVTSRAAVAVEVAKQVITKDHP